MKAQETEISQFREAELTEEELEEVAGGLSEAVFSEQMRLRERNALQQGKFVSGEVNVSKM